MMTEGELRKKANWIWQETLRLHEREPGIRIASSLSCVELLTVLYYNSHLRYRPEAPHWGGRDRFIASKGHGAVSLYPILADLGFFPSSQLLEVGQAHTFFGMIPDPGVPGIETINGSLGHGLGVGLGMAISLKPQKNPSRVVVLHGDGELGEGAVWEAVALAGSIRQNNLFLLLDVNKKSMLGRCPYDAVQLEAMFRSFSWHTLHCDGHDIPHLHSALTELFANSSGQPAVLLAETIKGCGVPELEKSELAHVMSLTRTRIEDLIAQREKR